MNERLEALRKLMAERHMDAYLIPTSDYHESEYVGEYFKCRKFITGFTGSAGTAIVTADDAGLWTDGRYFVQAAKQLEGSGFRLQKMGQEGVPTVEEYLAENLPQGGTLGFDGRVVNSRMGEDLKALLEDKEVSFACEEDLIGLIWDDRPGLPANPVWILEERYAGKPAAEKIKELREAMKEARATVHVLTTLDDIVWLLNIRGDDVPNNPVVLSYVVVTEEELYLFINEKTLDGQVRTYLEDLKVTVKPYDEIYDFVRTFRRERVLLESSKIGRAHV